MWNSHWLLEPTIGGRRRRRAPKDWQPIENIHSKESVFFFMRFGLTIFFSDFIFISSTHNRWVIVSSLDTFMRFMVNLWNVDRLFTNRDKCQRRGAKCKVPLSLAKAPQQKWSCTLTKSWRHPFWGERFSCKMLTLIDFLKLEQMWTNRWGRSGDTSSWVARFNCEKSFSNLPSDLLLLLLLLL